MDHLTELNAAHRRWQEQRLDALTAADGWLTLVDLVWLDDGEYRVGSDTGCDIRNEHLPALLGRLAIAGTSANWQPAAGNTVALATDRSGTPDVVRAGRISFFLIEREQGIGLRLRDELAATRTGFGGIETFPFAPRWQVTAAWDGDAARFAVDDHECVLRPQDPGAQRLHFVIADLTSGRETYGGGRFLYAGQPADGRLLLDFNRAINPPCAFTPFAVCPLPPPGNRLPVAVTAGEKIYR